MANANQTYLDLQLRYQHRLRRLASRVLGRSIELISLSDKQLLRRLRKEIPPLRRGRFDFGARRYLALMDELERLRSQDIEKAWKQALVEVKEIAYVTQDKEEERVVAALPVKIPFGRLTAAAVLTVFTEPFAGGPVDARTFPQWLTSVQQADKARIRGAVQKGLRDNVKTSEIIKTLAGSRRRGFADGVLAGTRRNMQAVLGAGITHVHNSVSEKLWDKNPEVFKFLQWVSVLDGITSRICAARDGRFAPLGKNKVPAGLPLLDPPSARPPAHPNCLPGHSLVSTRGSIAGATKRWFEGEMITLRTAGDHEVSCTPNHPILTRRGWVPAKFVNESDSVVRDLGGESPLSEIKSKEDQVPSRIEDVAAAIFERGPVSRTVTVANDFHGDGVNGEVCVVGANGLLPLVEDQAAISTDPLELGFERGVRSSVGLFGASAEFEFGTRHHATSNGFVGSRNLSGTLGHTSPVPDSDIGLTTVAETDSPFLQESDNRHGTTTDSLAYIMRTYPGEVVFDDVVSVRKDSFSGHVYNLDTELGWYSAGGGGIIAHNCRSIVVPVFDHKGIAGIISERPFVRETVKDEYKRINFRADARIFMGDKRWRALSEVERQRVVDKIRDKWLEDRIGTVPADVTYDRWLRSQPIAFQDEVLGRSKAILFRKGLSIDRFVDRKGRELTVQELKGLLE